MQRLLNPALSVVAIAIVLAACGSSDVQSSAGGGSSTPPPASTAPATSLNVTVWADANSAAAPTTTTVTATPPGATAADFAPPPADQACTMIYGGPGKATVTGTLGGAPIDATFTRSGGCEIARWDRMVELGLIPKGVGDH
jgi:hypothetical protein